MDIIDVAEKMYGVQLSDWQKEHIRTLDKLGKNTNIRIIIPRHNGRDDAVYFYLNLKELILSGETNDNKHAMSAMW
jgi:hypothetical protein